MSQVDAAVVTRVLGQWYGVADAAARAWTVDRYLVLGVICQESAGDPYAWRPELGFLDRYTQGMRDSIERVSDPNRRARYRKWMSKTPIVLASSYGLMQPLCITAIEQGADLAFPTTLCDPALNCLQGAQKLRQCFNRSLAATPGATRPVSELQAAALLAYNGGGDPNYPMEVLAWMAALTAAQAQP